MMLSENWTEALQDLLIMCGQHRALSWREFSFKRWFWPFFFTKLLFSQHSCISRRQFTALSRLFFFSFYSTSSSSMHMCISLKLFMPCFVFNTPSCKGKAARHKAVKTPLPSNSSHLGWRIYGPVFAPETEAERSLPGPLLKLGTLLFNAPPHFVSFLDMFDTAGWCHWQRCLTPIPQHLPSHLKLRLGFSSFHPHQ